MIYADLKTDGTVHWTSDLLKSYVRKVRKAAKMSTFSLSRLVGSASVSQWTAAVMSATESRKKSVSECPGGTSVNTGGGASLVDARTPVNFGVEE